MSSKQPNQLISSKLAAHFAAKLAEYGLFAQITCTICSKRRLGWGTGVVALDGGFVLGLPALSAANVGWDGEQAW